MTEEKKPEPKTGLAALDELFQAVNRSDSPGLVVGVAQHGRTVYRRGFGLASVELGVANSPSTRMRIGSTSKHFTCLAALLLQEEGKLDVDASVRRYVPELPVLAGEPTLRQLMTHSGGQRCYLDVGFLSDGMVIQPKGQALATLVRQTEVNFAPGEKMMYNNGGYHLLSIVIERVGGMPFEQFLKERIFTPLAMIDTASVPSDLEIHRGMATLHVPLPPEQGGGWRRGIFPTEEVRGEGAMISTVDDMLRWLAHMRGPKIVGSESSWRQMLTPARLNNGLVNTYALGLMVHRYRGIDVVHHAGGVIGGTCQMLTVPSQALDIIIITNGTPANPVELANKIVDAMVGDAALGPVDAKAASDHFKPMLGARYHSPSSGLVAGFVEAPDGRLGLAFLNGPPVPLRDEGEALRLGFEDMATGPIVVKAGELASEGGSVPVALTLSEAGHVERLERLPETPPTLADAGAALLGRYRAQDLGADARVAFEGEALRLRIFGSHGTSVLTLQAYSADVFAWASEADPQVRGVLSVDRGADGTVTGFRADSSRTRRMQFLRLAD